MLESQKEDILNKIELLWKKHNDQIAEMIVKINILSKNVHFYCKPSSDIYRQDIDLVKDLNNMLISKNIDFDVDIGEIISLIEDSGKKDIRCKTFCNKDYSSIN